MNKVMSLINELEKELKSIKASHEILSHLTAIKNSFKEESQSVQGFALRLFSDGACRGNPGPGAWGIVGKDTAGDLLFESSGVELLTTNNQMEMQGAIQCLKEALRYFEENNLSSSSQIIELVTDSKYVVDGITKWAPNWKRKGWKKSDGKAPENLELWKEFDSLVPEFSHVEFSWVKGHAGHVENERCDQLANDALNNAGY